MGCFPEGLAGREPAQQLAGLLAQRRRARADSMVHLPEVAQVIEQSVEDLADGEGVHQDARPSQDGDDRPTRRFGICHCSGTELVWRAPARFESFADQPASSPEVLDGLAVRLRRSLDDDDRDGGFRGSRLRALLSPHRHMVQPVVTPVQAAPTSIPRTT